MLSLLLVVIVHSVMPNSLQPHGLAHQASLSFTISWSLLKLISIDSVMPSDHLILCHPLLLLPSIFSSIRVFSNEMALPIGWSNYWSFNYSINPSSGYIQGWFTLRLTGVISLQSKGLSRVFFSTTVDLCFPSDQNQRSSSLEPYHPAAGAGEDSLF